MLNEDKHKKLQRLAFYACAIYALAIAALLHWRIDESVLSLGYDPNEHGRAIRIVSLLLLSGFSGYGAGRINTEQVRYDRARDAMLKKYGIEPHSLSAIRWAQIAGTVVVCSVLLIAR